MRTILLIVCFSIIILSFRHTRTGSGRIVDRSRISSNPDTSGFRRDIQPVLQKNCSPCHFTGGKMYATMPFDKKETIINHKAGILKRFSDKTENALIKQFIEQCILH